MGTNSMFAKLKGEPPSTALQKQTWVHLIYSAIPNPWREGGREVGGVTWA